MGAQRALLLPVLALTEKQEPAMPRLAKKTACPDRVRQVVRTTPNCSEYKIDGRRDLLDHAPSNSDFSMIFINQSVLAGINSGLKELRLQAHTWHSMLQNNFEGLPFPAFLHPHFSWQQHGVLINSMVLLTTKVFLSYSSAWRSRWTLMSPTWKLGNSTATSINCLFCMKNFEIQNKCIQNSRISAGVHMDFRGLPFKWSP